MAELGLKFPRWLGPIIGACLGAGLALRGMKRDGHFNAVGLASGAVCGLLAGCVLWLLDAPSPTESRQASLLGSLLAIVGFFPGCLPFVGLVLAVPAFLVNRRVTGWQNTASRMALSLSIVMTVIAVVASQLPRD